MNRGLACLLLLFISPAISQNVEKYLRQANQRMELIERAVKMNKEELSSLLKGGNFFSAEDLLEAIHSDPTQIQSSECAEDLNLLESAMKAPLKNRDFVEQVLEPMIDSAGRVGPAILKGHHYFAGHYSECAQIDYRIEGRERPFRADYFKVAIDFFSRQNSVNGSCHQIIPDSDFVLGWTFGVCLPASCSSSELQTLFLSDAVSANPVCAVSRRGDAIDDVNAGFYVTLSIMGVIFAICVCVGLVDFFLSDILRNKPITKSLAWKLFMSCSLYANIASIFDTSGTKKEGQIAPIHCIRFFSMCWVAMCHVFAIYSGVIVNVKDLLAITQDLTTEFILNGYFSVDSFFFIGGVLLTFLWFKNYERNQRQTNSFGAWAMLYVHRILRLSPPFYMIVLFYTFVLKQLLRNTTFSMDSDLQQDSCKQTWWAELTYLYDWINIDTQCLGYSWYLATDMQMFIFTPLLIIPLAIKPVVGFVVAVLLLLASTAVNIFLMYHYHWTASVPFLPPWDPEQTNVQDYMPYMYYSPVTRCQVYIIGILVGWFMQKYKRFRINSIVNVLLWTLTFAMMLCLVFGLHTQTTGNLLPIFWRAMYSAFSKPAWALCLSWILVSCYYGYGGPVNAFMSWHLWVPLGRLSYCGYLLHIPIIYLVMSQVQDEVYFSTFLEAAVRTNQRPVGRNTNATHQRVVWNYSSSI